VIRVPNDPLRCPASNTVVEEPDLTETTCHVCGQVVSVWPPTPITLAMTYVHQ
jgi:hypothetical protein